MSKINSRSPYFITISGDVIETEGKYIGINGDTAGTAAPNIVALNTSQTLVGEDYNFTGVSWTWYTQTSPGGTKTQIFSGTDKKQITAGPYAVTTTLIYSVDIEDSNGAIFSSDASGNEVTHQIEFTATTKYTVTLAITNSIVGKSGVATTEGYTIGGDLVGATKSGIASASFTFATTVTLKDGWEWQSSSAPTITNATGTFASTTTVTTTIGSATIQRSSTLQLTVAGNVTSVIEGGFVTFILQAINLYQDSDFDYTVTGITAADLTSGGLSGSFTIKGDPEGNATYDTESFTIAKDILDETETMVLTLNAPYTSLTKSVTIDDEQQSLNKSIVINPTSSDSETQACNKTAALASDGVTVWYSSSSGVIANGLILYKSATISDDNKFAGNGGFYRFEKDVTKTANKDIITRIGKDGSAGQITDLTECTTFVGQCETVVVVTGDRNVNVSTTPKLSKDEACLETDTQTLYYEATLANGNRLYKENARRNLFGGAIGGYWYKITNIPDGSGGRLTTPYAASIGMDGLGATAPGYIIGLHCCRDETPELPSYESISVKRDGVIKKVIIEEAPAPFVKIYEVLAGDSTTVQNITDEKHSETASTSITLRAVAINFTPKGYYWTGGGAATKTTKDATFTDSAGTYSYGCTVTGSDGLTYTGYYDYEFTASTEYTVNLEIVNLIDSPDGSELTGYTTTITPSSQVVVGTASSSYSFTIAFALNVGYRWYNDHDSSEPVVSVDSGSVSGSYDADFTVSGTIPSENLTVKATYHSKGGVEKIPVVVAAQIQTGLDEVVEDVTPDIPIPGTTDLIEDTGQSVLSEVKKYYAILYQCEDPAGASAILEAISDTPFSSLSKIVRVSNKCYDYRGTGTAGSGKDIVFTNNFASASPTIGTDFFETCSDCLNAAGYVAPTGGQQDTSDAAVFTTHKKYTICGEPDVLVTFSATASYLSAGGTFPNVLFYADNFYVNIGVADSVPGVNLEQTTHYPDANCYSAQGEIDPYQQTQNIVTQRYNKVYVSSTSAATSTLACSSITVPSSLSGIALKYYGTFGDGTILYLQDGTAYTGAGDYQRFSNGAVAKISAGKTGEITNYTFC